MINIPILRWGKPYTSLDVETVVHFETGEELAKVSQANPGIIQRDMRQAQRARAALRITDSKWSRSHGLARKS